MRGRRHGRAQWLEARDDLHAAEADLAFWKSSDASAETRRAEIVRADAAVASARARMWELEQPADMPDETVTLDGRLIPYRPWGEDRDADRRFLRRYIGKVTVARGQPLAAARPADQGRVGGRLAARNAN